MTDYCSNRLISEAYRRMCEWHEKKNGQMYDIDEKMIESITGSLLRKWYLCLFDDADKHASGYCNRVFASDFAATDDAIFDDYSVCIGASGRGDYTHVRIIIGKASSNSMVFGDDIDLEFECVSEIAYMDNPTKSDVDRYDWDRIAANCRSEAKRVATMCGSGREPDEDDYDRVATMCGSGRDPDEDEYDYEFVRGEPGYSRHEWRSKKAGEQFPNETVTKIRYYC